MTWDEIKRRFILEDSAWRAGDQWLKLKYVGSVKDYVKAFTNLLMEPDDMGDSNKLFYFPNAL